jgi:hypothetical protein
MGWLHFAVRRGAGGWGRGAWGWGWGGHVRKSTYLPPCGSPLLACVVCARSQASHYVGVGGAVFNDKGELLVIVEKYLIDGVKRWKLPGGLVEAGERLCDAVEREVGSPSLAAPYPDPSPHTHTSRHPPPPHQTFQTLAPFLEGGPSPLLV